MGIWAVAVLLLFSLWFALYRYPIYEIVYPRLRTWILVQNSHAYSPLPQHAHSIRVVRLKPGTGHDNIECDLIPGLVSGSKFEALSYVWGTTLIPHKVQVDGKPFYVTYNLYNALRALRYPGRERLIWIDAICINQYDNPEKSSQVQMMRDIYAEASKVVVWLGEQTSATAAAFSFVRQFDAAEPETRDVMWKDRATLPRWNRIRREFSHILEYEWWGRAWIIQEIVMAKDVVMQRGAHQVKWETLHKLLTYTPFRHDEFGHLVATGFAEQIEDVRSGNHVNDLSINDTLLGMAYRFRFQSATFGSDKIYALLGLLKSDNPTLLTPDYSLPPEDVFLQFTISSLQHNKDLTVIVDAAGVELPGVSWCRDWGSNDDGWFDVVQFTKSGLNYSASDSHPAVFKADIPRRILSLQGYDIDTIKLVGDFHQETTQSIDWHFALRGWEHVVGGPWAAGSDTKKAFDRTIVADRWSTEPMDWKQRIRERRKPPKNDNDKEYIKHVNDMCRNRRFFITEKGRFGLGRWNVKKGDAVCVLLGGETPFILRRCEEKLLDEKLADEERNGEDNAREEHYKVIGEAYVDGLMCYQGSMKDDINSKKVVLRWYHLR
ncbi:HET-domain-containing protein [Dothidotthia symphoricarpi CBS 119687]|uniref:HET-domain-containing protein n=1 Tax=Dothidotthia symphoricarpi CBS 119687 TaxID=1392245 RepID=A0A6A6A1B4_9PLEO|nr:HET-domain-containing protein [Dothidotthia symphoricarpi CBS 119687]KAF2124508.1 HET-domain-containing protein [Dothidotthia symphoricarpi CBS 119687]